MFPWLRCFVFLGWAVSALPSVAQNVGLIRTPLQWEGNRLFLQGGEAERKVLLVGPGYSLLETIALPDGADLLNHTFPFLHRGEPWVFMRRRTRAEEQERIEGLLLRREKGQWRLMARHEEAASRGGFQVILPLYNGRYFGVRRAQFQTPTGLEAPFYLLEEDQLGHLRPIGGVDGGIAPALFDAPGMPRAYQVVLTADFLTMVDPHPGWIWVYSLDNGSLKRVARIYQDLDEKRIKNNDFSSVVIGSHPKQDGTLLLAVRPENAALNDDLAFRSKVAGQDQLRVAAGVPLPEGVQPPPPPSFEVLDAPFKHHPEVLWIAFDPATGTTKRLDPEPEGAKVRIDSLAGLLSFRWIPVWDERVEFRSIEHLIEQAKQAEATRSKGTTKAAAGESRTRQDTTKAGPK